MLTGFLPPESVKDMLFKEHKTYEVLLDCLKPDRKSYFIGDVYWKDFIDQKSQKWEKVEFTNWFGSNSNQDTKVVERVIKIMDEKPDFDVIFTHFSDLDSATHKSSLHSQEATDAIERDEILLEKFMDSLIKLE